MLEILKKISSIALDVQHISRTGNALYNGAKIEADQLKLIYADLTKAALNIEADIKAVQELIPKEVTEGLEFVN